MNGMSKKVRLRKEQMAEERRKAEEEQYLSSLSEEERIAYRKNIEERGRRAMRLLAATMTISAGTFGAKGGRMVKTMKNKGLVQDSTQLREIIAEHPDLPIVVLAGENAWSGEFGWEYCANVCCEVCEILDCETPFNGNQIYTYRDNFEKDLRDYLDDLPDAYLLTDEEFYQAVKAEVAKYEPYWKKVIAIYADN